MAGPFRWPASLARALVVAVAVLGGCGGDAGDDGDPLRCLDGGVGDGGGCLDAFGAPDDASEGEPDPTPDAPLDEASCDVLVARACGTGGLDCEGEPGCVAARLVAQHEPERCPASLDDERAFPPCLASPCELLVVKVCGGVGAEAACAERPSCGPATSLYEADADDECRAALEDETLFAPCPEGT